MSAGPTFYLLPPQTAPALAWGAAAVGVLAWVGVHRLSARLCRSVPRTVMGLFRLGVAWAVALLGFQALAALLVFGGRLAPWAAALIAAVGVEAVLGLYGLERRTARLRRPGWLCGLRVALVLLAVLLLTRPVFRTVRRWRSTRQVVLLLDDSASMYTPDDRLPLSRRLRLARQFIPGFPSGPQSVAEVGAVLREWGRRLRETADLLRPADGKTAAVPSAQVESVRSAVRECLKRLRPAVSALRKTGARGGSLPSETTRPLVDAARAVETEAITPLTGLSSGSSPDVPAVLRHAAEALDSAARRASGLAGDVDRAFYAQLGVAMRERVDAFSRMQRIELARLILIGAASGQSGPEGRGGALLARLRRDYRVKLIRFAARPVSVELGTFAVGSAGSGEKDKKAGGANTLGADAPGRLRTDMAAALDAVLRDTPSDQLAGIVILSDGRHNAPGAVDPVAHQLGVLHIPVSSIVFGSVHRPPTDAAIVSVRAPETVYTGDSPAIEVEIQCNGLAGKKLGLALFDGDERLERVEVAVDSEDFRKRLLLQAKCTQPGLRRFRLELGVPAGDVCPANNEYAVGIRARDDHIGVLLMDNRPRWEFRYLKNLFAGRDRTVRTQTVLLHPDRIAGFEAPRPPVPAALSRAPAHIEADLPPASPEEWLKFDVIILGDLPAQRLSPADQAVLRRFVEKRAGTLVVIAGPDHMPHEYRDVPLAEMLPATCSTPGVVAGAGAAAVSSPERQWRIRLTPAGIDHVLMRLAPDRAANIETWKNVPEFRWRHPGCTAKPQAVVLAWALPPDHPRFLDKTEGGLPPAGSSQSQVAMKQQFIRDHAVILFQRFGLGRVVLLTFDETWRLRFRKGDALHHRFWGQLLRWAAADKLPAGGNGSWLGVDRGRYTPDMPVRVRAKLLRSDYTPVTDATPQVKLFTGKRFLGRYPLAFVPDSAGLYETRLDGLPAAVYRAELEVPETAPSTAVRIEFEVAPAVSSEKAELAPNRELLDRLASLTGGRVVLPEESLSVLEALAPAKATLEEKRDWSLWDSWPFLLLFLLLVSAEWVLRKRAGLP
ncbi:MAG: hypothetical protein GXP31_05925 [Kiritimatiellaeota bacterium]|nr:hypothetical protein [Kiritimatiellota bacterium]